MLTTIITNGYLLEEKQNKLSNYTDLLIVSIDSHDELHDEMRGLNGILERSINGIKTWKVTNTEILINSVVSKLNLDKISGLVKLSESLDVPISFEPMEINEDYNEQLKPSRDELRKAFSQIIDYKRKGYKIANSISFLEKSIEKDEYICHFPKIFITVWPHGEIDSCAELDGKWGNVKDMSFNELFNSEDFRDFYKKVENCNECCTSCVIESSLSYSLNPQFIIDKITSL